jgi:hypothetical protein
LLIGLFRVVGFPILGSQVLLVASATDTTRFSLVSRRHVEREYCEYYDGRLKSGDEYLATVIAVLFYLAHKIEEIVVGHHFAYLDFLFAHRN